MSVVRFRPRPPKVFWNQRLRRPEARPSRWASPFPESAHRGGRPTARVGCGSAPNLTRGPSTSSGGQSLSRCAGHVPDLSSSRPSPTATPESARTAAFDQHRSQDLRGSGRSRQAVTAGLHLRVREGPAGVRRPHRLRAQLVRHKGLAKATLVPPSSRVECCHPALDLAQPLPRACMPKSTVSHACKVSPFPLVRPQSRILSPT